LAGGGFGDSRAHRRVFAAIRPGRRLAATRAVGNVKTLLRRCLLEFYTLFVDDGANAALTVGWIVAACLMLKYIDIGLLAGPVLFAGLAAIFTVGLQSKP